MRVGLGATQLQMQVQAPGPPSHEYGTRLEVRDQPYERRVQVSQVLRAGEADRFLVRVGTAGPSRFEFRMSLLCNDGLELDAGRVRLTAWVPRSVRQGQQQQPPAMPPSAGT